MKTIEEMVKGPTGGPKLGDLFHEVAKAAREIREQCIARSIEDCAEMVAIETDAIGEWTVYDLLTRHDAGDPLLDAWEIRTAYVNRDGKVLVETTARRVTWPFVEQPKSAAATPKK